MDERILNLADERNYFHIKKIKFEQKFNFMFGYSTIRLSCFHPPIYLNNVLPHIRKYYVHQNCFFFEIILFNRHQKLFSIQINVPETVRKNFMFWDTNPNRSDQRLKLLFSSSFKIAMRENGEN